MGTERSRAAAAGLPSQRTQPAASTKTSLTKHAPPSERSRAAMTTLYVADQARAQSPADVCLADDVSPRGSADVRPPKRARSEVVGAINALASTQRGVVTRAQLVAAGLSPRAIDRRLATGALIRIHRSVYVLAPALDVPLAAETAAMLAVGKGAVLSHHSAAVLHGLRPGRARLLGEAGVEVVRMTRTLIQRAPLEGVVLLTRAIDRCQSSARARPGA